MAIDIIHEIFPGTKVEWERTARVSKPMMTINEINSDETICTIVQQDMSDDLYGPGVEQLKEALQKLKEKENE